MPHAAACCCVLLLLRAAAACCCGMLLLLRCGPHACGMGVLPLGWSHVACYSRCRGMLSRLLWHAMACCCRIRCGVLPLQHGSRLLLLSPRQQRATAGRDNDRGRRFAAACCWWCCASGPSLLLWRQRWRAGW